MSGEALHQAAAEPRTNGRVLLVSTGLTGEREELSALLLSVGYRVDATGLGEARWLWPMLGYDVVLIEASERSEAGIELCQDIKNCTARQRVVLLLGNRTGMLPRRFAADAVLSGPPTNTHVIAALHLLLAGTSQDTGEPKGEPPSIHFAPQKVSVTAA